MDTKVVIEKETVVLENKKHMLSKILCLFLVFIALICFFASSWYTKTYGVTGVDSIIYTLFSNINGAQQNIVSGVFLRVIVPALITTAALAVLFWFKPKQTGKVFPLKQGLLMVSSFILSVILLVTACLRIGLFGYIRDMSNRSTIFEERYVSPDSVKITFPEEKRNLIYILLESMETTYLSKEQGGAMENCLIPELYNLGKENINFSHNGDIGGFVTPSGATWTIAAITNQTAGIPLKAPDMFERNAYGRETFLPGVITLNDILKDNGYYQALMFGSDAVFANRDVYFNTHGMDKIYDLISAREEGLVPEDYYVWWGMEDFYLFDYAKDKLTEISKQDRPFAFTMLTVDTHHVAGYKCSLCSDEYEEQYDNVISCSSRQVNDFIKWIKRQDFYKNTTIVICGDHLTMDAEYIERTVEDGYEQHVYNCIINSPVTGGNYKNREFCAMDIFPTILASIGCEISGDRLGLGTNLFSDTPTLIEEMGYDDFDYQISINSSLYNSKFILNRSN